MKETMNEVLESIKQVNAELMENNIRLERLAKKMNIVFDDQQIIKMDMKEIRSRLDTMIDRFEEHKRQTQLKAVK